MNSLGIEETEM